MTLEREARAHGGELGFYSRANEKFVEDSEQSWENGF